MGSYPHEKVFAWLKNDIDVYIQPSLQEGLPRALIEAMSVGLPCIGSDVAGIPELLDSKCVFNRKGNKANSTMKLLKSLDISNMKLQAERNYKEAEKYNYNNLLHKRFEMFERFKSFYLSSSNTNKI